MAGLPNRTLARGETIALNTSLRRLLSDMGVDVGDTGARIVILNATGRIPFPGGGADIIEARGFNFVVLADGGEPCYYGKVRPTEAASLTWDTRVRTALRVDPELARIVPEARGAVDPRFLLQVAPFQPGDPLTQNCTRMSLHAWSTTTATVLAAANLISDRAPQLLPGLLLTAPQALAVEAEPFLRILGGAGVARERIAFLSEQLDAMPAVPRRLQHGDLWPGNIVRHHDRLQLLDYELYGTIQVPLYDVCHFLRTASDLRNHNDNKTWVERMQSDDAEAQTSREALRANAAAVGLTDETASACALYYLIDIAGRLVARGAPHYRRFVADVEVLADTLSTGIRLTSVFLGRAST